MRVKQRSAMVFVQYNSTGVSLRPPDVITLELEEGEHNSKSRGSNDREQKKKRFNTVAWRQ